MSNSTFTSASRTTSTVVETTTPSIIQTTPSIAQTTPSTTSSTSSSPPPSTITSSVSLTPTSTVVVTPSTTSASVVITSSLVVISNSATVVTVYSTQAAVTVTPSYSSTAASTSASSSPSILASGSSSSSTSGLGTPGTIAVAVIIPIVVIAALILLGIFLWRKRKARKSAEEQRKDEMAEYGYNPNNDPTLVPVGATYTDAGSEGDDGYRGWGTTSSNPRKASTTMGSNGRPANGMPYSDTTSQPGNYGSPGVNSEHWSGDPLIGGHHEGIDNVAALGGGAVVGGAAAAMSRNNRFSSANGVHRGPSNASSSYSHGPAQSETSSESPPANYYHEEVPYNIYNDVAPSHGPYGDQAHGIEQPVIRDVQARRNTKIERVPTFPQTQGGISQNF